MKSLLVSVNEVTLEMARTPLGPWKLVRDRGSSNQ